MNLLLLVADDLRPNLGSYEDIINAGGTFYSPPMFTPNMDKLAAESILFERAYVQQVLASYISKWSYDPPMTEPNQV